MKKINQKGFTHHLVMFAVLALVLGSMGFAGWRVYKNRDIEAKAAGWWYIRNDTVIAKACKVRQSSSFWTVRIYVSTGTLKIDGGKISIVTVPNNTVRTIYSWPSVQTFNNMLSTNSFTVGIISNSGSGGGIGNGRVADYPICS